MCPNPRCHQYKAELMGRRLCPSETSLLWCYSQKKRQIQVGGSSTEEGVRVLCAVGSWAGERGQAGLRLSLQSLSWGFGMMLLERGPGQPPWFLPAGWCWERGECGVLAGSVALGSPQPLGGCLGVLTARGDGQGGAGLTWLWS